ncbi:uncharacterized protein LOC124262935 [Haliotis rubra]|uniref:uncharacterized protein LOC124262935 n=1 Tax=Haliotis rubra TaxID=36100 RepID=UPI001EE5D84F|nr:uncharacterized protein LOC124262935 [Haliotis rubra]
MINGDNNTAVTVTYQTNVTYYNLDVSGAVTFTLDYTVCYNDTNNVAVNKAVRIVSSAPVSVYVIKSGDDASGGYMAIPTDKLSTKYFLAFPDSTSNRLHKWSVVSTEDDNVITVTLRDGNVSNCANHSMTLTLNKYDVFGADCQYDITGSVIESNKSIAVFTNTLLSWDQMLLPVKYYGKYFVLHNFADRPGGMTYKIVASENNTTVSVNPGNDTTMMEGDAITFDTLTAGQSCLHASEPVLVLAFPTNSTIPGQTFIVQAQPIERYVSIFRLDIASSLMATQSDLYVTLTFHERYYSELPPGLQRVASSMSCCRYMTVVQPLGEVDHNIVLPFPVGAVVHGVDNVGVAITLGMQFGARECPTHMKFIPETNTCVVFPDVGQMKWSDARDFCGQQGMQLPQLDTPEKNILIRQLYALVLWTFYIGANDMDADGVLAWQNGEVVNYTHWGSKFNPTLTLVNACVLLHRFHDHTWATKQCTVSRRFLCQLVLDSPVAGEDFVCNGNPSETPLPSTTTFGTLSVAPSSVIMSSSSSVPSHVTGNGIRTQSSSVPQPTILEASGSSVFVTQSSSPTPTVQFPSYETSPYSMSTFQPMSPMTSSPMTSSQYFQSPISPTSTSVCQCACSSSREVTESELKETVRRIKRYLTLDKRNLTNRIGRYICRTDGRRSAANIGVSGITCLVLAVIFVIVLDLKTLLQGLSTVHPRQGVRSKTVFVFK